MGTSKRLLVVVSVLVLSGVTLAQVALSTPEPVDTPPVEVTTLPDGMEFVSIPSGSFLMGSPAFEADRGCDERQHTVTVESFELMTTEVTQGMWEEVMGTNPAHDYGVGDDYPVYYVTWHDCQDFIDRLNSLDTMHEYRLPSEAEWEYACRAGTTMAYYWGETMRDEYCWCWDNSDGALHPVGRKLPNAWGLYDMSGNVWEWCQDVYTAEYVECPANGAAYIGSGSYRVYRGGGWSLDAQYCRSAFRNVDSPGCSYSSLGFRLARSAW